MPAGRPREVSPLKRPEFMSLNQPLRPPSGGGPWLAGGGPRLAGGGPRLAGGPRSMKGHQHHHHQAQGPPRGKPRDDDRGVPDGEGEPSAPPAPPRPPPEQDCMQLNPTFRHIAYNSLLAIDISLSKRAGVCVSPHSSWGAVRYLVSLLSLSGHGVTWVCGTLVCLSQTQTMAAQEVLINLLMALVLDVLTVAGVQKLCKRRGPWDLSPGFLDYVAMDVYSFPAAHASRAVLVTKFLLNHMVLAVPLRILLFLWAFLVGVSRVMLGRQHLSDVAVGVALGFLLYALLESVWLSGATCQTLMAIAAFDWSPAQLVDQLLSTWSPSGVQLSPGPDLGMTD